jgi:hypothetical protein
MDFSKPIEQFVGPHYLEFLHGNFLSLEGEELASFVTSIRNALAEIQPNQVERLLRIPWREQLTGAWFAGFQNWSQFAERIGELLLSSMTCYAGQGYCFALACFADTTSSEYLCRYLDKYLPQRDKYYDQLWAMSSLIWIDETKQTDYSLKFLAADGLWERFVADKTRHGGWDLAGHRLRFSRIMTFRDKWFGDCRQTE